MADWLQAALTINSKIIKPFLNWNPDAMEVPLSTGQQIQILPDIGDLHRARKHQYAAFIASEAILVVWDDDKLHLLERARFIEEELVKFLWSAGDDDDDEKGGEIRIGEYSVDEETAALASTERPVHYYHCFLVACTICLVTVLQALGYATIAEDIMHLHRWSALGFLCMIPISVFLSLVCFSPALFANSCADLDSSSAPSASVSLHRSSDRSPTYTKTPNSTQHFRLHG
jgi:hypothetical protein